MPKAFRNDLDTDRLQQFYYLCAEQQTTVAQRSPLPFRWELPMASRNESLEVVLYRSGTVTCAVCRPQLKPFAPPKSSAAPQTAEIWRFSACRPHSALFSCARDNQLQLPTSVHALRPLTN